MPPHLKHKHLMKKLRKNNQCRRHKTSCKKSFQLSKTSHLVGHIQCIIIWSQSDISLLLSIRPREEQEASEQRQLLSPTPHSCKSHVHQWFLWKHHTAQWNRSLHHLHRTPWVLGVLEEANPLLCQHFPLPPRCAQPKATLRYGALSHVC